MWFLISFYQIAFSIYVRSLGGNYILLPIFEKLESPPTKRFGPRDQMRWGRGEPGASLQIFTASEEIVDIFDFAQLHPKSTFPRGNERKYQQYEKVASEGKEVYMNGQKRNRSGWYLQVGCWGSCGAFDMLLGWVGGLYDELWSMKNKSPPREREKIRKIWKAVEKLRFGIGLKLRNETSESLQLKGGNALLIIVFKLEGNLQQVM